METYQAAHAPQIQSLAITNQIQSLPLATRAFGFSTILNSPVNLTLDRVLGVMLGVGIGDALGLPAETMSAEEIKIRYGVLQTYQSMPEHPYFGSIEEGEWSDDLQLTLAVADALTLPRGFSMDEIAHQHIQAMNNSVRGWGGTTRRSVEKAKNGTMWSSAALPVSENCGTGNGVPMKISPLALYLAATNSPLQYALDSARDFAVFTHATRLGVVSGISHIAALHYCLSVTPETFSTDEFIGHVVRAAKMAETLKKPFEWETSLVEKLEMVQQQPFRSAEDAIHCFNGGSCAVFDSLPFSYTFFLQDPHSVQSMINVINAGGDTDSNGALVAGLLGALHGASFWCRETPMLVNNLKDASAVFTRVCNFSDSIQHRNKPLLDRMFSFEGRIVPRREILEAQGWMTVDWMETADRFFIETNVPDGYNSIYIPDREIGRTLIFDPSRIQVINYRFASEGWAKPQIEELDRLGWKFVSFEYMTMSNGFFVGSIEQPHPSSGESTLIQTSEQAQATWRL